ncbi:MAG TPA: 1-deoxy-D-xylulose-5-phosphate reductoisomerase [bacterium]
MGTAHPPKRLLIQGATGSVGRSTLSVVREHPEYFRVVGLAARSNVAELGVLAAEFHVNSIALEDVSKRDDLQAIARQHGIAHVFAGEAAVAAQARDSEYDLLVNALTGSVGLEPTAVSLQRGLPVALANKETLVAAGPIIMKMAADHHAAVLPIDSEHSAIFQCLLGERLDQVRRIWLTTSGGPFWGRKQADLKNVSVQEALAHPTWKMGPKISIDSATLFNKGLEVIEAQRLFGVSPESIGVIAHRQSVVHSMVEFIDGSFKAQLSTPDMRLPILFSLSYPDRLPSHLVPTGPEHLRSLTFEPVEPRDFPCLDLAFDALKKGGTTPAALSAADEVAVDAFLNGRICFADIPEVIRGVVTVWPDEPLTDLTGVRSADTRARARAAEQVTRLSMNMKERPCC